MFWVVVLLGVVDSVHGVRDSRDVLDASAEHTHTTPASWHQFAEHLNAVNIPSGQQSYIRQLLQPQYEDRNTPPTQSHSVRSSGGSEGQESSTKPAATAKFRASARFLEGEVNNQHDHVHDEADGANTTKTMRFRCGVGQPMVDSIAPVPEKRSLAYHDITDARRVLQSVDEPRRRELLRALKPAVNEHQHRQLALISETDGTADAPKRRQNVEISESYDLDPGSGNFLPLSAAETLGLSDKLRIRVLYDVVGGLDSTGKYSGTNARQCTRVGEQIQTLCSTSGGGYSCTHTCTNDDLLYLAPEADSVAPGLTNAEQQGAIKGKIMRQRTQFAAQYWSNNLRVKPVRGSGISLHSSVLSAFNLPGSMSVSDADLVVIITARPMPDGSVSGM